MTRPRIEWLEIDLRLVVVHRKACTRWTCPLFIIVIVINSIIVENKSIRNKIGERNRILFLWNKKVAVEWIKWQSFYCGAYGTANGKIRIRMGVPVDEKERETERVSKLKGNSKNFQPGCREDGIQIQT